MASRVASPAGPSPPAGAFEATAARMHQLPREETGLPPLGAHIAGWSAFAVDAILRRHGRPYLAAMGAAQRAEVERTARAVHQAALHWRATSADGNAETAPPEVARPWGRDEITTAAAALMLGLSERRVRQLAAGWEAAGIARKLGRAWLLDRAAVEMQQANTRRTAA